MDKFEQIADAKALEEVRTHPGFYALLRILAQKKVDLFSDWASDKDMSKDFCKGALHVIETFEGDVMATIENGRALEEQEAEVLAIQRGRATQGGGSGDLAL